MKTTIKSSLALSAKIAAKEDAAKKVKDLFEDELKNIYRVKKTLIKALPEMEKKATDSKLKSAIVPHLVQTEGHVKHLEEGFIASGKKVQAKKCDAMAGLPEKSKNLLEETRWGAVRDAGIILLSQKAAHYEIASYEILKVLDEKELLKNLPAALTKEKKCHEMLTAILIHSDRHRSHRPRQSQR